MENSIKKPELLCPARDRVVFEAAISAGADAVYMGLGNFNARRNATNFSLDDLQACCHDAHLYGSKVFLTLNTLAFYDELMDAINTAVDAYNTGVDAVIVQDLGLAKCLQYFLPNLPMHASTQMNISDSAGISIAKKLGFSRVTLARECSLSQIKGLDKQGLEIEAFVHGVLCICQSGQCLFSSLVGGRSGNRGLCAQPCRLKYDLLDDHFEEIKCGGKYLLSPKDLCALQLIPDLINAGVDSFKIEGRMKSADYVYTVASIYRKYIDEACACDDDSVSQCAKSIQVKSSDVQKLEQVFSRGFSTGYLEGFSYKDFYSLTSQNNRGLAIGRINSLNPVEIKLNEGVSLFAGDLIEIWSKAGRVRYEITKKDKTNGEFLRIFVKQKVGKGDRVFKIRSVEIEKEFEKATGNGLPKIPVQFSIRAKLNSPYIVEVRDSAGLCVKTLGEIVEAARTKELSKFEIIEHFSRLGASRYTCEHFDIDLDEGVGVAFSYLHKLRDLALKNYEDEKFVQVQNAKEISSLQLQKFYAECKTRSPQVDYDGAPSFEVINFLDSDIEQSLSQISDGCSIGPKLYATNLSALYAY
ncbi:MAG: U32 family peptidase, partial [Coriobacteriales bacterium]|nr:U32 family peptidase [Coriobacteriales bacterium]